ncbi:MAG: tetratricopeptide repeat protein [Gemmatimonadetes bacterium]|nr:tetratricopeptide repeat protein [Gemmatimonadota bacterium]
MTTSHVIHLDDYRTRREQRRREFFALYGADGERSRIVLQLWRAASLLGADRAATVWIDEYGPGLVHVYCLLDLASDPPRRTFTPDLLRRAWEQGVPGICDIPDTVRAAGIPLSDGVRSACAIALGSDGARAWFLVVDSLTARGRIDESRCADLMFSAGECAGLVLHRDLGEPGREGEGCDGSVEQQRRTTFAGWPVLRDIEGREQDEDVNQRIARRFLVVRVVRTLVDEDFALDPESLHYQVEGVRGEIRPAPHDEERAAWEDVLAAAEHLDRGALARALLGLGELGERQGHLHGAREIYRNAYDVAAAAAEVPAAIDSARFYARACRKLADWPDAEAWYSRAFEMADTVEDHARCALTLDGLASTYRFRGNMPKTRETLERVLEYATRANDRQALASAHHHLMVVEKHFERTLEACVHGWKAVDLYEREADRLLALFDLADILVQARVYPAARDAYAIVAHRMGERDYRLMAIGGLALTSALLGEKRQFRHWSRILEEQRWQETPPPVHAQILFHQGVACAQLGYPGKGRRLLTAAVAMAEENRLNKLFFQAEAALKELGASRTEKATPARQGSEPEPDPRLAEVSGGLSRMRAGFADAPRT